uniref:NADH dehydrogenase subunit 2 n=1 Tax=Aconurella sibirica TaxID=2855835 RepID=UPI002434D44B|nr:NADH dehydrogenase subunit 2 [Aconurella sibirica]WEU77756.1 NADH dehydrogenase subunit 2 [Aconurella sibirica]
MFFNSTKLMLSNTMMIGVIMTICSNNWVSMWMGMEISLISFIPLMNSNKINSSSESMIKYFIIQSISSTMLLFSVICMLIGVSMMNEIILTTAMMIKMGLVPFHNWVLLIIEHLEYSIVLILLTILKLPPISITYQINSKFLLMPIILSLIVSSICCVNQSSIRKTLTYSSIFNMSLMISSINKLSLIISFISVYSINMTFLVMLFSTMKMNFINQILFNEYSTWMKLNIWMNMLSMSGFPPTLGFVTKMMVIQEMVKINELILVTIMIMTSLLVLFFYTRLAFSSMMISYSFKKWEFLMKTNSKYFMMMMSILMSPLILTLKMVF